ncbi:hypothetical protein KEJ15_00970 [Candidatus Bathyarchaeota archaeon]|nr:hypothetical protein [Candidatus Bathyarchaeota archaeon]
MSRKLLTDFYYGVLVSEIAIEATENQAESASLASVRVFFDIDLVKLPITSTIYLLISI